MKFDQEYDSYLAVAEQTNMTRIQAYLEQILLPSKPSMTQSMIKESTDSELENNLSKQLQAKILKTKLGYLYKRDDPEFWRQITENTT